MAKPLVIKTKDLISAEAFKRAFSRFCDLFVWRKEGYGLSKNDFSDLYRAKLDMLENYRLPPATDKALGGIIAGNGLSVSTKGVLDVKFPDLSNYVTFGDLKRDNAATELRFTKIENTNKRQQENTDVFKNQAMKRIELCESKITETEKQVGENLKRFDNYPTISEYDTALGDIREKLANKADADVLDKALNRKIAKNNLDGALINFLNQIKTEQEHAAEDRENIRSLKSDIISLNNLRHLVQENNQDINYIIQDMKNYVKSERLNDLVKAEAGKGLSERNFTNKDWDKLQELHNYTLPPANRITLGGVKVGENINVDDDGTISVAIPTAKDYIRKVESQRITDSLDERLTECENSSKLQSDTLNTMSASLSTAESKVKRLEAASQNHTNTLLTLATKSDLAQNIDALNKSKLNADEFKKYVSTKIGANNLTPDVNDKLNSTIKMSVSIDTLQRAVQNIEDDNTSQSNRIKSLNSLVTAIRNDIPNGKTYVRAQDGKKLSSNDFTDAQKAKLASALTMNDIGTRVVGLDLNNKIDSSYLPKSAHSLQCIDDIILEGAGSDEALYFNRKDKKLYYYDGVNYQPIHDNLFDKNGVDLRTEMADLYVKKAERDEDAEEIRALQKRVAALEQKLNMYQDETPESPEENG